ncbi:heavy-metal-associated domain-containing protein [Bauldia litoralis]|uniref:heavy-metal-associated domain-containing protein n=1 Tax=Bauldia litoralis TaxID=665467 RepID=UPI0032675EF4
MKRPLTVAALAVALGSVGALSAPIIPIFAAHSAQAQAADVETVTFAIENMTCALCPITVRTVMAQVDGVRSVKIDFDAKTALVSFDPSVATVEAIAAASTDIGYPAKPAD